MSQLLTIAQTADPSDGVQFRPAAYGADGIPEFLRDVIALANASVEGPRYLVTGVEIAGNNRRRYHDVGMDDFRGKPAYLELINEYIEPVMRVSYQPIAIDGTTVGVYEIAGCYDKPYMMRVDLSAKLRRGDAYARVHGHPVKLGRSQLQQMFEKRFRDSVSADRIEVGFPSDIIQKDLPLPVVDLSGLPSENARAKLKQLVDILAGSSGVSLTSTIGRLTHARLFGQDSEFRDMSADEILEEMQKVRDTHRDADNHYLYEEQASRVQLVVLNQGNELLENASLTLALPRLDGLYVADRLPLVPRDEGYVERSALETESYPPVSVKGDGIRISMLLGDIPGGAPAMVFESPLRLLGSTAIAGKRVAIRYRLSAGNLRTPATGKLRLLFAAA